MLVFPTMRFTDAVAQQVVIDFNAVWCGPCKMISPFYKTLATTYSQIIFLECDVDEVAALASREGVSAMPTFFVYQGGKKVDELVGANKAKLEEIVKKYT